ncbi:MAG: Queuine tRNA-ribosyltransferase [Synergistales bacterium 57_84]|nr:MAG: Queuine tRNA-ribosyltransferase [Synergistales bacterium 57_84]
MFGFRIDSRCPDTMARTGEIRTERGSVPTPAFMPVGTRATVKAMAPGVLPLHAERDIR